MIQFEFIESQSILVVSPQGSLGKDDFEQLATYVDPIIGSNGKLKGLMVYTKEFPGWKDFAALLSHLTFIKDHHALIEKVAAVTDSNLLSIMPSIVDHFVHAEIRHFEYSDKENAMDWLVEKD